MKTKKGLRLVLAACLLAACLPLTASAAAKPGASRTASPAVRERLTASTLSEADFDSTGGVTLETEHAVYGGDISQIYFTVRNQSGSEVDFGSEYRLEALRNGAWMQVGVPSGELNWTSELYMLQSGDSKSFHFSTAFYACDWRNGSYRIAKQISGKWYKAEFRIGSSPVTAATPFGFGDIGTLPAAYTLEQAKADGAVAVGPNGLQANGDSLVRFLEKVRDGVPAMARYVTDDGSGKVTVEDIEYDPTGVGRFLYRRDNSRSGGGLSQSVYSFAVVVPTPNGGKAVLLRNRPSMGNLPSSDSSGGVVFYDSGWRFSAREDAIFSLVKELEKDNGGVRLRIFSGEGDNYAALPDGDPFGDGKLYFSLGNRGMGTTVAVEDEGVLALTGLQWLDKNNLAVLGEASDGRKYMALYKVDFTVERLVDLDTKAGAWYGDCFAPVPGTAEALYWSGGALKTTGGKTLYTAQGKTAAGIGITAGTVPRVEIAFSDDTTATGTLTLRNGAVDSMS